MAGTTPKIQAIGVELRRARENAGLSARQLATKLGKAHTTIGRWESGERAPRPVDVATVLSVLGADNDLREELIDLARDSEGRHWTATRLPEMQRQMSMLLELEREATRITTVSPLLVPGLLQTADYARAMMVEAAIPPREIDLRVTMRVGRRDVLLREHPAKLFAVTSEAVLHALIGGPHVMAEQLRALLCYADMPNVELRVLPLRTHWHPGLEGAFTIREFSSRTPVVYTESSQSGQFFHELDHVTSYRDAAVKVSEAALSPAESIELIARARDQMETTS